MKNKYSLINEKGTFKEGDIIEFEMPSFCSGEYNAVVKRDPDFGLYIDQDDNYFKGCRDYEVIPAPKEKTMIEKATELGIPEGQQSIDEWILKLSNESIQEKRNYERFCRMVEHTGLENLIGKLESKYNSDKYVNREYGSGFQPREELKEYLLTYFTENGEETNEGINIFMESNYKIGNYLVGQMMGQGSYIKIQTLK